MVAMTTPPLSPISNFELHSSGCCTRRENSFGAKRHETFPMLLVQRPMDERHYHANAEELGNCRCTSVRRRKRLLSEAARHRRRPLARARRGGRDANDKCCVSASLTVLECDW